MSYQDVALQSYLDVLVLRDDGSYDSYVQGLGQSDTGRFSVEGDVIHFRSTVAGHPPVDTSYALLGDSTLRLTLNAPGALPVDWSRSDLSAYFLTKRVGSVDVPINLPDLVSAMLDARVRHWSEDALPVMIDVEPTELGRTQVTVHFYSPSSGESVRFRVDEYHADIDTIDGSRLPHTPLPPEFVDLADVLATDRERGGAGDLRRASLRTYDGPGPVWMLSLTGPRGTTYSATTGKRIEGDVTGYVAQYERDWHALHETWSKWIANARSDEQLSPELDYWLNWHSKGCGYNGLPCGSYRSRPSCVSGGGRWVSGGCQ